MRTMLPLEIKNYTNVLYVYRFNHLEGKTKPNKVYEFSSYMTNNTKHTYQSLY